MFHSILHFFHGCIGIIFWTLKNYKDEIKVTIVATGVDQRAPSLVIDNEPSMKLNPVGLDKDKTSQKVGTSSAEEIDFLDVPTFMRKQVD